MIRDDSKNILLSVFGVALLLIAVVGITYAVYVYTSKSSVNNKLTTGTISMDFIESEDTIRISNAAVIVDDVGKKQSEYFDFSVSSVLSGETDIGYDVYAESIDVEKQIDPKNIKLYLEKEKAGTYESVLEPTFFNIKSDSNKTMLIYKGKFTNSKNETNQYKDNFRLRMWLGSKEGLDGSYKEFRLKVNVSASNEK